MWKLTLTAGLWLIIASLATPAVVGGCKISTPPCAGKTSGLECNPKDPGSFYNCDGVTAHLQHCPVGLVFDSSVQVCDWPSTAVTTSPPTQASGCKISVPPCTGKTSGLECNPKDPGSFYNCDSVTAHLQHCPAGLVFKTSSNRCDWPTTTTTPTGTCELSVKCDGQQFYFIKFLASEFFGGTITTTTTASGCKISAPPCTGKTSGLECNPKDPGSFYNCDGETAHLQHCPAGLVFKTSSNRCDWPTTTTTPTGTCALSLKCDGQQLFFQTFQASLLIGSTTTTTTPPPTKTPSGCKISAPPCTGKTSGHECNPKDRGSFYHCDGQRAHLKHCPADTVFDPNTQVCVWP